MCTSPQDLIRCIGGTKEWADEVAKPLSLILEKSWQCGEEKGKHNPHFSKGKERSLRKLQAIQSHLCAWQDHGADTPGKYAKAYEKQRVIGGSQYGFTKGKLCLANDGVQ